MCGATVVYLVQDDQEIMRCKSKKFFFSPDILYWLWDQPRFLFNGNLGSFTGDEAITTWSWPQLHLAPRLRMSGVPPVCLQGAYRNNYLFWTSIGLLRHLTKAKTVLVFGNLLVANLWVHFYSHDCYRHNHQWKHLSLLWQVNALKYLTIMGYSIIPLELRQYTKLTTKVSGLDSKYFKKEGYPSSQKGILQLWATQLFHLNLHNIQNLQQKYLG
jgi:hypothetical protein